MDIQAESEKYRGPLSIAVPSCRVNFGADNVDSMHGFVREGQFVYPFRSTGKEARIINPSEKG